MTEPLFEESFADPVKLSRDWIARGHVFDVRLGEPGGTLQHCASWQDREQTYRQGAVGVWEHGGEAGEYRALCVDALDHAEASTANGNS